jgi:hypothetical protein
MTVNYTTLLGLAKPVSGTETGTWGDTVNNNLTDYLDSAVAGAQIISGSLTAVTLSKTTGASLSQAGTGATGSSQYQIIRCTGNPASLLTITAPAADKTYIVINATSTSQSVKIVGAGPTTGITILSGKTTIVAWNGTDFVEITPSTISGVLPVANGGTGTTTPALVAGTNVTISGTWPNQTINSSNPGGTVTSVAALTLGTSGTDVSSTVANSTTTPVITLNIPTASATNRGVLSAADWISFNAKGSGAVTSVSGTAPVVSSGGTTPAISMAAATSSVNGYLTSTDWNTFNGKYSTGGALGTPSSGTLTNCTGYTYANLSGTTPTWNQNTTGTAANLTAATTLPSGMTLVAPILGTPASGTLSSCTVDGTDAVGFRNIPINSQSAAYTAVLADSGKCILHPSTDANARTFTIPANGSVAYPIGTAISFVNMNSQVVSIAITTDTMYLAGTGTTGTRSLAHYGTATALKLTSTTWIISGAGLT